MTYREGEIKLLALYKSDYGEFEDTTLALSADSRVAPLTLVSSQIRPNFNP